MPTDNSTIKNSFRAVKADILQIQGELMNIKAQQIQILEQIEKFASKLSATPRKTAIAKKKTSKKKVVKKKVSKKRK